MLSNKWGILCYLIISESHLMRKKEVKGRPYPWFDATAEAPRLEEGEKIDLMFVSGDVYKGYEYAAAFLHELNFAPPEDDNYTYRGDEVIRWRFNGVQ